MIDLESGMKNIEPSHQPLAESTKDEGLKEEEGQIIEASMPEQRISPKYNTNNHLNAPMFLDNPDIFNNNS